MVGVPFTFTISALPSLPVKTISGLAPLVVGSVYVVLVLVGKVTVATSTAVT